MKNRVLIADDDESILWVLKQMLGDKKIEIAEARDGKSALEMLKGEDFSLAVMDIRMPEKDGLDVLKEVKEAGSQTPVIIMTAQGTMNNAIEAMKLGAFDYITKPFDISEMEIIVDRALDYRKLKEEGKNGQEDFCCYNQGGKGDGERVVCKPNTYKQHEG